MALNWIKRGYLTLILFPENEGIGPLDGFEKLVQADVPGEAGLFFSVKKDQYGGNGKNPVLSRYQ